MAPVAEVLLRMCSASLRTAAKRSSRRSSSTVGEAGLVGGDWVLLTVVCAPQAGVIRVRARAEKRMARKLLFRSACISAIAGLSLGRPVPCPTSEVPIQQRGQHLLDPCLSLPEDKSPEGASMSPLMLDGGGVRFGVERCVGMAWSLCVVRVVSVHGWPLGSAVMSAFDILMFRTWNSDVPRGCQP